MQVARFPSASCLARSRSRAIARHPECPGRETAEHEAIGDLSVGPQSDDGTADPAERFRLRARDRASMYSTGLARDDVGEAREDAGRDSALPRAAGMKPQTAVVGHVIEHDAPAGEVGRSGRAGDRTGRVPDAGDVPEPLRWVVRFLAARNGGWGPPISFPSLAGQRLDRGGEVAVIEPHHHADDVAGDVGRLAAPAMPNLFGDIDAEAVGAATLPRLRPRVFDTLSVLPSENPQCG